MTPGCARPRSALYARFFSRIAAIVLVVALGGGAYATSSSSGATRSSSSDFLIGVDEDGVKWGGAKQTAAIARALGVRAVRITVPWREGRSRLSSDDRAPLAAAVRGSAELRLVVAVYGPADAAPRTPASRAAYCSFVADILRSFREVNDVVIWNESNDSYFWRPQFGSNGTSSAPAAYEALLAACWDTLHAVRPGVNVLTSTSPRGNDSARARGPSHSPGRWYRLLGVAYRTSGRARPIFDTVGHDPYPNFSAERPWTRHPGSSSIGQGDYDKLMSALEDGFARTGQPVPGEGAVRIWYLEQGFQSTLDPVKADLYSGAETERWTVPAWSSQAASDSKQGLAPDQATQLVDAVRLAYCQPNVAAFFNFGLADETDLARWQSGVLWADWTAKPSFSALKRVIDEINDGAVDCAAVSADGFARSPPGGSGGPTGGTPISAISRLRVTARSAFSATVAWSTALPTGSRVAYGLRETGPTLWSPSGESGLEHQANLSGLSPATSYRLWVPAPSAEGQTEQATLDLRTLDLPATASSSIGRGPGMLLLDGEPFFPLMLWGACPHSYGSNLDAGINLFAENPCGGLREQMRELRGQAFSAGVADGDAESAPGLLGFFYPDEADARGLTGSTLPSPPETDGVSFLTLTNHFYTGAAPLPAGRRMYPGLIAATDMVGFDLYPLQEWCRPDRLADVYDAQRELARLAPRKPTFQWIESAQMKCGDGPAAVTPETVRAEAWLAIAGDARGLGFFPATWTPSVGRAIAGIRDDIAKLGPALLGVPVQARWEPARGSVRVGARVSEGALYVIAVNASRSSARTEMHVPGLDGRVLRVVDESRQIAASGDTFSDSFGPLAVHIYIAAPPT